MPLTYAYRKHPHNGLVQHVLVPLEDLPRIIADGWYDSPSKVPDTPGYVEPNPEPAPAKVYMTDGDLFIPAPMMVSADVELIAGGPGHPYGLRHPSWADLPEASLTIGDPPPRRRSRPRKEVIGHDNDL